MSMLADQGDMKRSRAAIVEHRATIHKSEPRPLPVATHPFKRCLDVLIAAFALLLFLPLLLMVSAAIRLESRGPAIFRQRRTGYRGEVFTILKFRTMTVTEDSGAIRHATKNDKRVTQVGAVLRKLSIDELPQLKGDMSIVGPRPHALAHDEYYGALIPTYSARFRAKPGQHLLDLWLALASATAGSGLVDHLLFVAGRRFRTHRWVVRATQQAAFARALKFIERYPISYILAFRFIFGLRIASPIAIGVSQVPTWRFTLLNIAGAVIWATTFTMSGFVFGEAVHNLLGRGHHAGLWTLAAAGGLIVAVILIAAVRYLLHRRKPAPAPDA